MAVPDYSRRWNTLEEHVGSSGFGSKILEWLESKKKPSGNCFRLSLPDEFIEHGDRETLLDRCGLSVPKIAARILSDWHSHKTPVIAWSEATKP